MPKPRPQPSRMRALRAARAAVPSPAAPDELSDFLQRIGERVRTMRSRRAMSRKLLSRHSKVSERYLAQLEAGKGNFSIVLLRRVAQAFGVHLSELVDERPDRSIDALLLGQFLERYPNSGA